MSSLQVIVQHKSVVTGQSTVVCMIFIRGIGKGGGRGVVAPPLFERGDIASHVNNFLLSAMPLHRQMTLSISINV